MQRSEQPGKRSQQETPTEKTPQMDWRGEREEIQGSRSRPMVERVLIGIPTKDRHEYLSGLLATILFQTYPAFDVLIVDSSEERGPAEEDVQVDRFVQALRGVGRDVFFVEGVSAGASMVAPTNRILVEAEDRGYDGVFKVDDDHVMPPGTLHNLLQAAMLQEATDGPEEAHKRVLVSGVTPWMHRVWKGASGPDDAVRSMRDVAEPISDIWLEPADRRLAQGYRHHTDVNHFDKFASHVVARTTIASAANFLMRPDTRILWSDMSGRSNLADIAWFLQLQRYLGYELYFETGVWVWHVVAPSGGTRKGQETFDKGTGEDEALRRRQIDKLVEQLGFGAKGYKYCV